MGWDVHCGDGVGMTMKMFGDGVAMNSLKDGAGMCYQSSNGQLDLRCG